MKRHRLTLTQPEGGHGASFAMTGGKDECLGNIYSCCDLCGSFLRPLLGVAMTDLEALLSRHYDHWRRTELWPAIASVFAASLLLGATLGALIWEAL